MRRPVTILTFFVLAAISLQAQFAGPYSPPPGEEGSNAVHRDSSLIERWGEEITVIRGPRDIAKPNGDLATAGDPENAVGASDGRVVSLGDGGSATYYFVNPLKNVEGPDFAVFENGFYSFQDDGWYLELAFVEVSSNGTDFVRFPAHSLTQTDSQVWSFGVLDPTHLNNLAGNFPLFYGTPFDLEELRDSTAVDINNITHIRIIDVVGSIDPQYATYDTAGNSINDPYPTDFPTGGFDLDAVAVLNPRLVSAPNAGSEHYAKLFPNPARSFVQLKSAGAAEVRITALTGKNMVERVLSPGERFDVSALPPAVYYVTIKTTEKLFTQKLVISR